MDEQSDEEGEAMIQETLVIAGGCFWCVEAVYSELKGVIKAESGYCGGQVPNPTYEQVCTGATGHAEAVRITYDPKVITAFMKVAKNFEKVRGHFKDELEGIHDLDFGAMP